MRAGGMHGQGRAGPFRLSPSSAACQDHTVVVLVHRDRFLVKEITSKKLSDIHDYPGGTPAGEALIGLPILRVVRMMPNEMDMDSVPAQASSQNAIPVHVLGYSAVNPVQEVSRQVLAVQRKWNSDSLPCSRAG